MSVHQEPNRIFPQPKTWHVVTLIILAALGAWQVVKHILLILDFIWSILNNVYG